MVDALLVQGGWSTTRHGEDLVLGVPDSLQALIAQRFARCTAQERRVLTAASVAGIEFAAVAAGVGLALEAVEACCTRLARRGLWLRTEGPQAWPDGTVSEAYRFAHALYQEVLYHRATAAWRQRLHRHIGARLAASYGAQARDLAATLAGHFVHGGAYAQAIPHLRAAAE
jgi:predicted ATPase